MIKAIIFDLDGTLIDSLDDIANACNFSLNKLGYPTHNNNSYKDFIGDGILKLIERALPIDNANEEEVNKLHKVYVEYYSNHMFDRTKIYDGITDLLEFLNKKGYSLAIVSNKPDSLTKKTVQKFFREELFNIVTGKKDEYEPKPNPDLTNEVIKDLGINPDECAFVGDSSMDILTAINANVLPIGVSWGFRSKEELIQNGAKYIVDTPSEIIEILDKINNESVDRIKNADEYKEPVFLTSVSNDSEADIIESLLSSFDIPILKRYQGAGDYMKIYMGSSNSGIDILVPFELLETAQAVLSADNADSHENYVSEEINKNIDNKKQIFNNNYLLIIILFALALLLSTFIKF